MREITNKRIIELGDYLSQYITFDDSALTVRGCNHTLDHTLAWIAEYGYDREIWLDYLQRNGGMCDCEVLLNVVALVEEA